jgi:hypothetical protein
MPANITDDPTSFPTVTTPVDADTPNAASLQVSIQQLANRTAYLNAGSFSGKIFEGFESATFPPATPAGFWSAPSVRFNTDVAYARDTVNPITGTASANRGAGQGANQSGSLGLSNVYLDSPSRISFVIDLLCNASFGDHLDFYIDGVLTAKWSTTTNATISAGRFVSDVLREGVHTFDWRFVRGASVSVASEKARIDAVNITPESVWSDRPNRIYLDEDFLYNTGSTPTGWTAALGANPGSVAYDTSPGTDRFGVVRVTSGAVGIGDQTTLSLLGVNSSWCSAGNFPFLEFWINLPALTNIAVDVGIMSSVLTDSVTWRYDSSLGTDWKFRTSVGGVATTNPTGLVAATGWTRLALFGAAGLTNGNGWLGSINGQVAPGAGANHMGSTQNLVGSAVVARPVISVASRTVANGAIVYCDLLKVMSQRSNASLLG